MSENDTKLNQLMIGMEVARNHSMRHIIRENVLNTLEEKLTNREITAYRFAKLAIRHFRRYTDELASNVNEEEEEEADLTDESMVGEGAEDGNEASNEQHVNINNRLCPVCMLADRNAAFNPCGHTLCYECANRIRQIPDNNHCHACRSDIHSVILLWDIY